MGRVLTIEMLEKIDQYLKGTLDESEKHNFEQLLQEDEILREEVIIQKQLYKTQDFGTITSLDNNKNAEELSKYKDKLRNKENVDLSNKIREIGRQHLEEKSKTKKKKNSSKYYIAASIAFLLTSIFLFNRSSNLENYYNDNVAWEELPSFVDKGNETSNFTKGELYFKNKEYKEAILLFNTISPESELYPFSLMYLGASYDQLNENKKALESFNSLSKLHSFQEYSRGYWYSLLIHLKQNNKEKALEMKAKILENENNYNYKKALELNL